VHVSKIAHRVAEIREVRLREHAVLDETECIVLAFLRLGSTARPRITVAKKLDARTRKVLREIQLEGPRRMGGTNERAASRAPPLIGVAPRCLLEFRCGPHVGAALALALESSG